MPRPPFHATFPGPAAGSGPLALLMRVLMVGMALFFALIFVALAFALGAFFLLLRALGLGGKIRRPAAFGTPFGRFQEAPSRDRSEADFANEPPTTNATNQQDTVKQLEEFHGSLDEFLKHRKSH